LVIELNSESQERYNAFQQNRLKDGDKKVSWITFKLNNQKNPDSVVYDAQGTGDWEEFCKALPEKDCRFAFYNLSYTLDDGISQRDKVLLIQWSPEASPTTVKMSVSSTLEHIKTNSFRGVGIAHQADSLKELNMVEILDKARKSK